MFEEYKLSRAVKKFSNHAMSLAKINSNIKGRKNWLCKDIKNGHVGAYAEFKIKVERQIQIVNESLAFISESTSGKPQSDISRVLGYVEIELKELKKLLVSQHTLVKEHGSSDLLWKLLKKESEAIQKVSDQLYRGQDIAEHYLDDLMHDVISKATSKNGILIIASILQFATFAYIFSVTTERPQPTFLNHVVDVSVKAGLTTAITTSIYKLLFEARKFE